MTARKVWMTTENRTVTTWRDRRLSGETGIKGCRGLAGRSTSPVRKNPFSSSYGTIYNKTPQGCARAGEDEQPTGLVTPETTQERTTTTNLNNGNVCICGKVCKNQRGLKIHMGKMKCKPNQSITQRTGQPGETEEEVVQDTNHSDHSLHVLYNEEDRMVERN